MKINTVFVIFCLITSFENYAQKSIMLDNIHYVVGDSTARQNCAVFFKTFFKAKEISEQSDNPLTNTDILSLNPEESTINISENIDSVLTNVALQATNKVKKSILPVYGMYWLAINTKNIAKTVKSLLKSGYDFAYEDFKLPNEPNVNAVAMYGFDNNIIVLVERPQLKSKSSYSIDHSQLIVKNLELNLKFYQDVLGAEIVDKKERSIVIKVGNQRIVLSEPEALGLVREQVLERNPTKVVSQIDYISFLFDEIEPAYYAAKANNYTITIDPQILIFKEKPTRYTICRVLSPDNFQIELLEENGRTTARSYYKTSK